MNGSTVVLACCLLAGSVLLSPAAPPPNDLFANRATIVGDTNFITGSNVGATAEADEPPHAGQTPKRSLWWTWTAPVSGVTRLGMMDIDFDGILAVYTGATVSNLVSVASTAPSGTPPNVIFNAAGGRTYQMVLDSKYGYTGDFTLIHRFVVSPPNDNFSKRTLFTGTNVTLQATTQGATREFREPDHNGSGTLSNSVWWSWIAPTTGRGLLSLRAPGQPAALAVYTGNVVTNLVLVGRQASSGSAINLGFYGASGQVYQVALDALPWAANPLNTIDFSFFSAPPNDHFTNRTAIVGTSGVFLANNAGATSEPGEPYHYGTSPNKSVWWSWTAPSNGRITFSSRRSSVSTFLSVYTGNSVNQLFTASGLSRYGPDQVQLAANQGTTYQIAVDTGYNPSGNLMLEVSDWISTAPPPNDAFASRIALTGTNILVSGTVTNATRETPEPAHAGHLGQRSVWYTWTAPISGSVTVTLKPTPVPPFYQFSPMLAVYTGTSLTALTSVASDHEFGTQSAGVQFSMNAGQTFVIAVDAESYSAGPFDLTIVAAPPPSNDPFANRIPVSGDWLTVTNSSLGATKETGEPNHAGSTGKATVWWSWTPQTSGPFSILATGTFNTVVAVYQGESFANFSLVASNDDFLVGSTASRVTFFAYSGQAYEIAVAGRQSTYGDYALGITPHVPPTVMLTSPASNLVLAAGSDLVLTATAGDEDGDVTAVQFHRGITLLGTITGPPPYTLTLTNLAPGDYSFTATAIDNDTNATTSAAVSVRVPPLNDNFAERLAVLDLGVTMNGTVSGSSREPGEPVAFSSSYRSVWWHWTPLVDGYYMVTGRVENASTYLSVFSGTAFSNLVLLGKSSTTPAVAKFTGQAGVDYALCVETTSSGQGPLMFAVQRAVPNDHFTNATVLTGATNYLAASNVGTSKESGEPSHANYGGGSSVWWTWTAPASGNLRVSVGTAAFDPLLGVYSGNSVASLTRLASLYDSDGTGGVSVAVAPGGVYRMAVDSTGGVGDFGLNVEFIPPPLNDDFTQAHLLVGESGFFTGHNIGATKQSGETNHSINASGKSVWWFWLAPADGALTLSNAAIDFNGVMAVYRGGSWTQLSPVAVDSSFNYQDKLACNVQAGMPYYFVVDGSYDSTGTVQVAWALIPLPSNDRFTDRIPVSGYGTVTGSNLGATSEPGEPTHTFFAKGRSVWWAWTAPETASVSISTEGSEFWTALAVYTGDSVSNLTLVAKDDHLPGKVATFNAVADSTYLVAVDSSSSDSGAVVLTFLANEPPQASILSPLNGAVFPPGSLIPVVAEVGDQDGSVTTATFSRSGIVTTDGNQRTLWWTNPPLGSYSVTIEAIDNVGARTVSAPVVIHVRPVNDRFVNALTLSTGTLALTTNTNATRETGEPDHAGNTNGASLWWTWTAPASGNYQINTEGSSIDTVLAVYTGDDVSTLSLLASNDNASAFVLRSAVNLFASEGAQYQIAVQGRNGATGVVAVCVVNVALNDHFADRQPITALGVPLAASNRGATPEADEPFHAFAVGGHSLWWTWTAPHSGVFLLSVENSTFDTVLAVYSGTSPSNLTLLASNDDFGSGRSSKVSLAAIAGATYEIAVDGYGGATGDFSLLITPSNPPMLTGLTLLNNGVIQVNVAGEPNRTHDIMVSTNLIDWTPIYARHAAPAFWQFVDPGSTNLPQRFYRLRQRP